VFGDELAKLKETMNLPFGQVPVLVLEDGTLICQSLAILRYFARRAGIYGKDIVADSKSDMLIDGVVDLRQQLGFATYWAKPEEKDEKMATFWREHFPRWGLALERIIKQQNTDYYGGSQPCIADYLIFDFFTNLPRRQPTVAPQHLAQLPVLEAYLERMGSRPKIEKWVNERPVTET